MSTHESVAKPAVSSGTVCHIGDIVNRGNPARPDRAIATWVGPTHSDVYLIYLQCPLGAGTISTPGIVKHIGFDPEQDIATYEISSRWMVVDTLWPSPEAEAEDPAVDGPAHELLPKGL